MLLWAYVCENASLYMYVSVIVRGVPVFNGFEKGYVCERNSVCLCGDLVMCMDMCSR